MSQQSNPEGQTIQWGMRLNYPPTQEGLAIPVSEWDGLIHRLKNLQPDFRLLPVAYSIFFGIGVTAGLSIAPLLNSNLPSWVLMSYVAICAASLALGLGILISDKVLSTQRSLHIDQLAKEMTNIKDRYLESRTLPDQR